MKFADVSKLEDLSIRLEGLQSMSLAIRDCVIEGPNTVEAYEGAIDLHAVLMIDFKKDFKATVKELTDKVRQEKTA